MTRWRSSSSTGAAWCPYCNIALNTYQAELVPELARRGVALVAISPQAPDGTLSTQEKNELTFTVLSDLGNQVAKAVGILTAPSAEARAAQLELGLDLAVVNADGTTGLPMPTTIILDADHVVRWVDVHPDYTTRSEPAQILAALDAVALSMTAPFEGRVALVTGAGRGIGRAVALELAASGAHVALLARSLDQLDEAAEAVRAQGGNAAVLQADLGDPEAVAEAAARAEKRARAGRHPGQQRRGGPAGGTDRHRVSRGVVLGVRRQRRRPVPASPRRSCPRCLIADGVGS